MTERGLMVKFSMFLILVLVAALASVASADQVIVGTRIIDDGTNLESDIAVLDSSATAMFDTSNFLDVEFLALSAGSFTDPNLPQIAVSVYYPDQVKSFVRCSTVQDDSVVDLFNISSLVGYKINDIVVGQWPDSNGVIDDEDEFAVCCYRPYYGPPAASTVRTYDNNGDNLFNTTTSQAPGEFLALAAGFYDSDSNMEIAVARFIGGDYIETDLYAYDQNIMEKNSKNVYPAKFNDVIAADLNADGIDEMLVAVDRSFLQPPSNSYVSLYTTWSDSNWTPTVQTTSFSGEAVALAAGNFDADENLEFVVIRVDQFQPDPVGAPDEWVDETELRIYDDDLSLIEDSSNPLGKFTAVATSDLDNDGLDEIIVGYSLDETTSTIRVYDSNAALVSESSYYSGRFSDLAVLELGGQPAPTNCLQVWQNGYGLATDLNKDCKVDLADLAVLAADWQRCNIPGDPACEQTW